MACRVVPNGANVILFVIVVVTRFWCTNVIGKQLRLELTLVSCVFVGIRVVICLRCTDNARLPNRNLPLLWMLIYWLDWGVISLSNSGYANPT